MTERKNGRMKKRGSNGLQPGKTVQVRDVNEFLTLNLMGSGLN